MAGDDLSADEGPDVGGPPPGRGRIWVIAVTVALVAIPLLWSMIPVEVARWYEAAAQEAEWNGDLTQARVAMDEAVNWCPTEPYFLAARAGLRLQTKDVDGALADCQAALALDPAGSAFVFYQRAMAYQRRGDHARALEDIDRIVDIAADAPPNDTSSASRGVLFTYDRALNLRAYSRALAGQQIDAALLEIEDAMRRAGDRSVPAYLDTRGYLKYLAGDYSGAEADMRAAIEPTEAAWQQFQAEAAAEDDPLHRIRERQFKEDLAVMYQHRALIAEKLGQAEAAAADFARAKEFGYSPEDGVW